MKTLAEAKIIVRSSDPDWVGEELFRLQGRSIVLDDVRSALSAILDAVDYTRGACRLNEQLGAVLPTALIENARKALAK